MARQTGTVSRDVRSECTGASSLLGVGGPWQGGDEETMSRTRAG
jgi:hypothetical protein